MESKDVFWKDDKIIKSRKKMKQLREAAQKEISYLTSHPVVISEKLDMVYFKMNVDENGITVFNSKGKPISDIDCIVNSVNNEIMDFVKDVVELKYDDIYDAFGNCRIGIFYCPKQRTNVITYILDSKFILGDFYTEDKSKRDDSKLLGILNMILGYPVIVTLDKLPEGLDLSDSKQVVEKLTGGKTWSGNDISYIEGIVIECGKMKFQVTVNDVSSKIDKEVKKLYRDAVLENLTTVIFNDDEISIKGDNYIDRVCNMFLEYISNTNIFSKMYIEPADLLPPTSGYIGDLVLHRLPSTTKLVCKGNPLYKNILRMFLVTFNRSVFENKFKEFSPQVREKLTKILLRINS